MKKLVVCGDSFAKGIGCRNLETEPYGSLVAKSLGLELVNIAKGSSTNYSIFAQVLYAIENIDDIDMILVTSTSYDRVEWFKHNENPTKHQKEYLTNYDINYHEYPPYMPNSYTEKIEGEQHIMSEDLYLQFHQSRLSSKRHYHWHQRNLLSMFCIPKSGNR